MLLERVKYKIQVKCDDSEIQENFLGHAHDLEML